MVLENRSTGVLLHASSLPGPEGIGTLGAEARRFVDWLQSAGVTWWQVLPLVPPGAGFSPYSSAAAFAGSPWLIDLADAGVRSEGAWTRHVDVEAMQAHKKPLLAEAGRTLPSSQLDAFARKNPWAEEAALFFATKEAHGGAAWWLWPTPLRDREPEALAKARKDYASSVNQVLAEQFLFAKQWQALREYAHARGVLMFGDIPIYVDADSADVWAHRSEFQLDETGTPHAVAGVPPDYFSATGQLWGNPLYDWQKMATNKHAWWTSRFKRALELYDLVRIDHFRGLAAYWAVPLGAPDARTGEWRQGPGRALFDDARRELGDLPIVAEDLGKIDAEVRALRDALGFPGMRILQFAFGEDASHAFLPHNYPSNCVTYTGTHDNDTTLGWWKSTSEHIRDHVRLYLGRDGHDAVWDLIRAALASTANTAIFPMQDLLTLGSEARMNLPSLAEGNWLWRVSSDAFSPALADRLRSLSKLYGRCP